MTKNLVKEIDPGHAYEIPNVGSEGMQTLQFIKKESLNTDGTELKTIVEGTSTEKVLDVVAMRLKFLFEKLPDSYTKTARFHIGQAIFALGERTMDRKSRGVEGTLKA